MQKRSSFQIRSDAAKQRWVPDAKKELFWRKHVEAWRLSGESKRGYCIKRNLSESSFSGWMRELNIRDREKASFANAEALLSTPVNESKNLFVPLRLINAEESNEEKVAEQTGEELPAKKLIDILVPGGAVIRVDETCSPEFIADLFATLNRKVR